MQQRKKKKRKRKSKGERVISVKNSKVRTSKKNPSSIKAMKIQQKLSDSTFSEIWGFKQRLARIGEHVLKKNG